MQLSGNPTSLLFLCGQDSGRQESQLLLRSSQFAFDIFSFHDLVPEGFIRSAQLRGTVPNQVREMFVV